MTLTYLHSAEQNKASIQTKILTERFFLGICQADLQDISSQNFPLPLKISQIVSLKEIKDAIRKLSIGKATGPDRIPNKAIKAALKAITTPLIDTTTTYLFKSKILECYKKNNYSYTLKGK